MKVSVKRWREKSSSNKVGKWVGQWAQAAPLPLVRRSCTNRTLSLWAFPSLLSTTSSFGLFC